MTSESNAVHIVDGQWSGKRLDQYAASLLPAYSREQVKRWILSGEIQLDHQTKRPSDKVSIGQQVTIDIQPIEHFDSPQAQDIPLSIIYEDNDILIIDKPAGLIVHPGNGHSDGTLMNALLYHVPHSIILPRAGIVHRLDKDTSGLLVVAKTMEAHTNLVRQLKSKQVRRIYRALVHGTIEKEGLVDAPIGRHRTDRVKMAVIAGGKEAVTHFRPLDHFHFESTKSTFTWIECQLETGRTHQIRVHLQSLSFPLVGDSRYGLKRPSNIEIVDHFPRQVLHASELSLIHPSTQEVMTWASSIPNDIQQLLDELKRMTLKKSRE